MGLNTVMVESITLHSNNKISIALTKNAESQHQTKHINIQYYYIRELVSEGEFTIKWVLSSEMLTNGMTKTLPTEIFRKYRALLGMSIN